MTDTPNLKTLDAAAEYYRLKAGVPGLAVGTLIDGDFRGAGFGIVSLESQYPTRTDTLFQIGSNTKVMTATLVMQLVEQGKLQLDTPIGEYLPDLELSDKDAQDQITMRHLLTHQSGIDGDIFDDTGDGDDALEKLVAKTPNWSQETKPGEHWSYCNAGFYLAGRIIEVLEGDTYENVMTEKLFKPLGMERTCWHAKDAIVYSAAAGHQQLPGQDAPSVAKPWPIPRSSNAAGAVISNVEEVLKFMNFHMSGGTTADNVISAKSIAAMQEPQRRVTSRMEWGIGWTLGRVGGERVLYHGGTTNGQTTQMFAVPSRNFAISVLTNGNKGPAAMQPIINWALKHYLDLEEPKAERIEMSDADLERYAGLYQREIASINVSVENNRLKLLTTVKSPLTDEEITPPPSYLVPVGNDEFLAVDDEDDDGESYMQFIAEPGQKPTFIRAGYRLVKRAD